jgi:cell division protein ZapA (FtsZ GTPase activity inhibitor)
MSNKPWHCGTEDEYAYVQSAEGTFYALSIVSATNICDTLNRLEAENAELRERLKESEEMKKALMVTDDRLGNIVHNLKSTTQTATEGGEG